MYDTIKIVIDAGRYALADMLQRIDFAYVQGYITNDQHTELVQLARDKADPVSSYAPLQEQVDKLADNLAALAARVTALESGGGDEPEPTDEYPAYVQPTGAHDAYHKGDKATWNGKRYVCTAPDGVACVWNPDTYPAYWQEVV